MIDARRIICLSDPRGVREEEIITQIVAATNAELERIVREFFTRFARDYTEQDIAAVLRKPVEVRARLDRPWSEPFVIGADGKKKTGKRCDCAGACYGRCQE